MRHIIIEPLIIILVLISYKIFILGEYGGYKYIGWLLLLIIISIYFMFSAKARKKKSSKSRIRSADELTVSVSFAILGFLVVLTEKMGVIGNIVIGCIIGLSIIRAILHMYLGTDENEKDYIEGDN